MEMADALKAAGFIDTGPRKKKKRKPKFEFCSACGKEITFGGKCRCNGLKRLGNGTVKRMR